ncbi:MAG: GDP-L-fucose synthase, partial [Proteobacteria bacterium]|nr:GDP-L-fucose synthase [Pseudomonadota bacterium]
GIEISIKDLVSLLQQLTGYFGKVVWDASKPDGQPRRLLDISKAHKEFGFQASTSLVEGLKKTVDWYRESKYNNIT